MAEITFKLDLNLAHDDEVAGSNLSQALKKFAQRCLTEDQAQDDDGYVRNEDISSPEWAECEFQGTLESLAEDRWEFMVKVELNDLEKNVL